MSSPARISSPAKLSTPTKLSSPAKTKQPKKRQKTLLFKSPGKKDGDIRALFSTATKSTKNYTKLINDLGIQNDGSIPTRLINLLVDLNVESTNTSKICFICDMICNCNILMKLRTNEKKPALFTYVSEPNLPDVDLIDDFNADLILKCAKNDDENLNFSNQNIVKTETNYLDVDNKNNSKNNFDLEFDFDSPIDLTSPEAGINEKLDENLDKNFDIGDIEDIFAESSPEEAIAKEIEVKEKNSSDPKEALGFFGLDSIDDIFADSDESADKAKTPEKQINIEFKYHNVNKASKTPEKTVLDFGMTQKNIDKPISEFKTSPSILSGKPASSTSPILCSQVRKFKLSTKKNLPQSSTPTSNVKRRLIADPTNNNTILSDEKGNPKSSLLQNSTADTSNKSMFTITQLVDMINKTDHEKSTMAKTNELKKESPIIDDNRSTSPILLTQAERKKVVNNSTDHNSSKINISQHKTAESLIILESDSDSEDTQIYELDEKINEINTKELSCNIQSQDVEKSFIQLNEESFRSPMNSKRKLEDDEKYEINASPFFNKRPKLDTETKKQLTLQEKVLAALTSNKMNKHFNNDANINFVVSPQKLLSQKENQNPMIDNLDNIFEEGKEYVKKNNLEMLQMFRRDSKVNSPKHKFDSIFSQRAENSQKRKLAFSDSDDDFIEDNNSNVRSQRPAKVNKNNSITNHKVRKVSKGRIFLEIYLRKYLIINKRNKQVKYNYYYVVPLHK